MSIASTMSTQTQYFEEAQVVETLEQAIIVFNDDVNTFDHVIDTFVDILKHSSEQAEQCAWIIHTKGKCKVKNGDYDLLEPLCTAILDRGISAEIH
jgi:ATP-dependent Clp protease adaptor protein ClpS